MAKLKTVELTDKMKVIRKREKLTRMLKKKVKKIKKSLKDMLMNIAEWEVQDVVNKKPKPKFVFMINKKSPPQYNQAICTILKTEEMFIFTACTYFNQSSQCKEVRIMIQGPEKHFNALSEQIIGLLKAEGEFKNGAFEGKAMDMSQKNKCKKLIEQHFNTLAQTE